MRSAGVSCPRPAERLSVYPPSPTPLGKNPKSHFAVDEIDRASRMSSALGNSPSLS